MGAVYGVAAIGVDTEEVLRIVSLGLRHGKNVAGLMFEFKFEGDHMTMPSGGVEMEVAHVSPWTCVHRSSPQGCQMGVPSGLRDHHGSLGADVQFPRRGEIA